MKELRKKQNKKSLKNIQHFFGKEKKLKMKIEKNAEDKKIKCKKKWKELKNQKKEVIEEKKI